ncbi:SRPBCC family protein [Oleiharenicola lentus]|uniref:SRPBCC family protein n=1 Tax=Oleiharenicola lentus TaxID=2508720 RepID=UPI003F67AD20
MKLLRLPVLLLSVLISLKAASTENSIVSEAIIDAPIAAVWTAWTTSDGLRAWVAPHAEIELRLDGLMRTNYDPKGKLGDPGTIENRILAYEPERLLVIRVAKAPEKFPFREKISDMWTVLHFKPVDGNKTHLRVVGLGFGTDEQSQKMKTFFQQGNDYTLVMLQKHLKR